MENLPKRKQIRLKEYDYSQNGRYFVTICTKNRCNILSIIRVGGGALDAPIVKLTPIGEIVDNEIIKMNGIYENIKVTDYVIMPNHIHLIIIVSKNGRSGAPAPTRANSLIPGYISALKRFTNKKRNRELWQRSYYDHIIRNEVDYIEKRNYIRTNPFKWSEDEYYI